MQLVRPPICARNASGRLSGSILLEFKYHSSFDSTRTTHAWAQGTCRKNDDSWDNHKKQDLRIQKSNLRKKRNPRRSRTRPNPHISIRLQINKNVPGIGTLLG